MTIVLGTMSFVFSQALSSKDVSRDYKKERKRIEAMNEDPQIKAVMLNQLDSTYKVEYEKAVARENGQNAPTTGSTNRTVGANVNLPGFQGGSYSIKKSADSYAEVIIAEATAYSIRTYADAYKNSTATENSPNVNTTLKCLLRNEDYRNVVFTIKGVGGVLIITPTVPARGELEIDLPPGIYTITTNILAVNKTESKAVTREVGNPAKYSFWAGKKYWFVLTQPMDN